VEGVELDDEHSVGPGEVEVDHVARVRDLVLDALVEVEDGPLHLFLPRDQVIVCDNPHTHTHTHARTHAHDTHTTHTPSESEFKLILSLRQRRRARGAVRTFTKAEVLRHGVQLVLVHERPELVLRHI
jgi:hypothetical protein